MLPTSYPRDGGGLMRSATTWHQACMPGAMWGIPSGGTTHEANIAGLPPSTHLADGGLLLGGWYRMGQGLRAYWCASCTHVAPSCKGVSAWGVS